MYKQIIFIYFMVNNGLLKFQKVPFFNNFQGIFNNKSTDLIIKCTGYAPIKFWFLKYLLKIKKWLKWRYILYYWLEDEIKYFQKPLQSEYKGEQEIEEIIRGTTVGKEIALHGVDSGQNPSAMYYPHHYPQSPWGDIPEFRDRNK